MTSPWSIIFLCDIRFWSRSHFHALVRRCPWSCSSSTSACADQRRTRLGDFSRIRWTRHQRPAGERHLAWPSASRRRLCSLSHVTFTRQTCPTATVIAAADIPYPFPMPMPSLFPMPATLAQPTRATADDADDNYQGGPTIFDRRGSGAASYIPPVEDAPSLTPFGCRCGHRRSGPPQQPTPGLQGRPQAGSWKLRHRRPDALRFDARACPRVALADLDLEATRQENDDRGVIFQLPPTPQAN